MKNKIFVRIMAPAHLNPSANQLLKRCLLAQCALENGKMTVILVVYYSYQSI
jgi:hypothetical protein